jgi:hypothetical protein
MSSCFHRSASVISDGVFCHPALFICAARSRTSAPTLAQKAFAAQEATIAEPNVTFY